MATTRVKDISSTATSLASDDYIAVDGATNGTRKMVRGSIYTDVAAAFTGAPTTYDICPLNSGTNKVDATYLPTGAAGTPKGAWDANANSPALADGAGTAGDYYDVTVAGSQDLGSGSIAYTVGDVVKYDGSTWYKIDSVANFLDGYSTAATSRTALEVNSVDEDAEANGTKLLGPSVYFDGVNDVVTVADAGSLFHFNDGTDDLPFTVSSWVKINDAADGVIASKFGSVDADREWYFYLDGSDLLTFSVQSSTGNYEAVYADAALTGYEGQWVHLCATYGGSGPNSASSYLNAADEMTLFVNGSSVAVTNNSGGSYAGMPDNAEEFRIGARAAASYFDGEIRSVQIHNRELTAAQVADLARGNELGFADEWGDHTANIYTGDSANFASSLGNWIEYGSTSITVAQSGGVAQITNTAASTGGRGLRNPTDTISEQKRYRMEFTCAVSSGTGQEVRIRTFNNGSFLSLDNPINGTTTANYFRFTPTGSTVKYSFEFVAAGTSSGPTDYLIFDLANNTGNGEVYDIDDVKVVPIGTLADFRSERFDSSTGKWYDLSDNAFVGTNSGATLVGREVPVYETGTWTPVLTFGGGSTGITYTSQEGYYTRIGNTVTATGGFILSAKGSSTGSAAISLPLTARNTTDDVQGFSVGRGLNMAGLTSAVSGYIVDNTTSARLMDWGATGAVDLDEANFTNTTEINMTVTYQIA